MSSLRKDQKDEGRIIEGPVFEPVVFLGYDKNTDTTTYRCPECGYIDKCPGDPPSIYHSCKKCTRALYLFNHKELESISREDKDNKKKRAEAIIPFIASFSTVLFTYIFLKSVDGYCSIDAISWVVLTIFGGICFLFGYVILDDYK